ncbi:hypothetical protein Hanom_Chr01g00016451 [Helianthus anomalus]
MAFFSLKKSYDTLSSFIFTKNPPLLSSKKNLHPQNWTTTTTTTTTAVRSPAPVNVQVSGEVFLVPVNMQVSGEVFLSTED